MEKTYRFLYWAHHKDTALSSALYMAKSEDEAVREFLEDYQTIPVWIHQGHNRDEAINEYQQSLGAAA